MANHNIEIYVGVAIGALSNVSVLVPDPFDVVSGDTVTFINDGESKNSVTVGGFDSTFWTVSTTLTLAKGVSSTRTIKAGLASGTTDALSFSSLGYTSDSLTFSIAPTVVQISVTSPPIKMSDIMTFYGQSYPKNLTNFRRGAGIVPDITENSGIPASGTITLLDFLGCYKNV